ncbi:hypothetical protein [Cytobacillus sp. IB215665]|uniref:hypothetical protein n=1 Tax=Cytobacillus sp. IB215665 TaxID=3097357 RepID=UPI002A158460|nr:hypothetical protein [Cytobacillus sp. IB215665]MDX8367746.1 hypothetical protein [Cytobacillus sp. IB215665]
MNTIIEDFLELKEILNSFNGLEKKYNWLLTDLDWAYPESYLDYFMGYRNNGHNNIYLITGENLKKLANMNGVYFIWGVFSAIPKNEIVDLDKIKVEPYADGNPGFWMGNPAIQHPKASVELVLWDSTLVVLLSKDDGLSSNFRNTFNGWNDLNLYNQ